MTKKIFILFLCFFSFTQGATAEVTPHVLRLSPGEDPKVALQNFVEQKEIKAASIVSAVGSLSHTVIRYANQKQEVKLEGFREVVTLSGTIGKSSGPHLHIAVSDDKGATIGGHLGQGSKVYTTLEVVLLAYPQLEFDRIIDPKTTFKELNIRKK